MANLIIYLKKGININLQKHELLEKGDHLKSEYIHHKCKLLHFISVKQVKLIILSGII